MFQADLGLLFHHCSSIRRTRVRTARKIHCTPGRHKSDHPQKHQSQLFNLLQSTLDRSNNVRRSETALARPFVVLPLFPEVKCVEIIQGIIILSY